jgi:TonB family protein
MRADAAILTANTVLMSGTRTTDWLLAGSVEDAFSWVFSSDGRIRIDEGTGDKRRLQVFDGSTLSVYSASTNTYMQGSPKSGPPLLYLNLLRFGRDSQNIVSATIEREEAVDFAGKATPCYVVRAAYAGTPQNLVAKNVSRMAWITRDREIVARDAWELESAFEGKERFVYSFANIEWGVPLAGDLFAFRPPPNSRLSARIFTPANAAGVVAGALLAPDARTIPPAVIAPAVIAMVSPQYSPEARASGYQGDVLVSVQVGEGGQATNTRIVRGLGLDLDDKAAEAVKQWQFKPGTRDGKPVEMTRLIEVPFRLPSGGPWQVSGTSYKVNRTALEDSATVSNPKLRLYASPDASACAGTGGHVVVSLDITADGTPSEVGVGAPGSAVSQAAVKAVQSWRYDPALENGEPRASSGSILLACDALTAPIEAADSFVTPYKVGNGVSAPVLVFKVEPEYSEEARKARYQGPVSISLVVDATGRPTRMSILRSLGLGLDEKALEGVAQWRFEPATKDGGPVPVQATVQVNFKLLVP